MTSSTEGLAQEFAVFPWLLLRLGQLSRPLLSQQRIPILRSLGYTLRRGEAASGFGFSGIPWVLRGDSRGGAWNRGDG